jgi:hypothetical protein
MNLNQYLTKFLAELEHLADGHGTRHAISTTHTGQLEVRLGADDWYWAVCVTLDNDSVKTAQRVSRAERYFPTGI